MNRRPPDPRTPYVLAARLTLAEIRKSREFSAEDLADVGALAPGKAMPLGANSKYILMRLTEPAAYPIAGLVLTLEAVPNRDFPDDMPEGSVNIPAHDIPVASLREARMRVLRFIDDNQMGGGNCSNKTGRITRDGVPFCCVGYSGGFWKLDKQGRELCVELDERGEVIAKRL